MLAAPAVEAQLAPPATGGAPALDRLLQAMADGRRVLVIGAHPDDEDTAVLTYAVQALGADAAYLSLTRGEGGQNAIGSELGIPLGLVRAEELAAARAVDGARQYFTRAYDFGYTRSLAETERFWPPDSVLKDAVRVVRRFRPHVIVSVFSGTPRDGHGQHQMAGVIARRVFEAAGDAARFPELVTEEGLEPWTPLKLYRSTRFDATMTTVTLPTGDLDARTGKTFFQIAMASRSQHRSQDFGVLQPTGPRAGQLGLMASRVAGPDTGLFAGIPRDTSRLARLADSLRQELTVARPAKLIPGIVRALDAGGPRDRRVEQALAIAQGMVLDAVSAAEILVPGETVTVTLTVYNAGATDVALDTVTFDGPRGWSLGPIPVNRSIGAGRAWTDTVPIAVPRAARTSQPYFLDRPLAGAMYDWTGVPPAVRGEPFGPPLLTVRAAVRLHGVAITLDREVSYRYVASTLGEVRRPLRVVPAVTVRLHPERLVWSSIGDSARVFTVAVRHHARDSVEGVVRLVTDGWPVPPPQPFALSRRGEGAVLTFRVRRPPSAVSGAVTVRATAHTSDGRTFDHAVDVVDYAHIRATPYVTPAASEVRVAPVRLPSLRAVGYVRGVSDRVPEALASLGVPLELLDAEQLARGDLSRFDVIVIGARAYESDTALVRYNDRVLAYVRDGGRLVVQYQQYPFVEGGYAPYPLTMRRPHDRVTDETAPVRILVPEHPVFQRPHRIAAEDWDGWPQERGLYFAGTWDERYTPLLEMQDPETPPLQGGLLVAPYGRGTYVYTGISFFRSLPAAVPGAVRLFLNLLAAGER